MIASCRWTAWCRSRRPAAPASCCTGSCPHYSGANRSAKSRQAYTVHVIDGRASYRRDNWLQRGPELPLRGFDRAP